MIILQIDKALFTEFQSIFKSEYYSPQNPAEELLLEKFQAIETIADKVASPCLKLSIDELRVILAADSQDLGLNAFIDAFLEKLVSFSYVGRGDLEIWNLEEERLYSLILECFTRQQEEPYTNCLCDCHRPCGKTEEGDRLIQS